MPLITLSTDFGTQDWFVGVVKGVILSLCPRTSIVDITHEIPPGDVRAGALALACSFHYFPKGTVHLVVVDPGVGSARAALAIATKKYFFVGPDNGVLSWALRGEEIRSIRRLENPEFFLKPVSQTFHGRDIFAPAAARLAKGLPIQKLGPTQKAFVRLPWPVPSVSRNVIRGEIVGVDRFGNLITNISGELVHGRKFDRLRLVGGVTRAIRVATHFQVVPAGKLAALIGSSGLVEIAVNGGSAAQALSLETGDRIALHQSGTSRSA